MLLGTFWQVLRLYNFLCNLWCFCRLVGIFVYFWVPLNSFWYFNVRLDTFGYFWILLGTFGYYGYFWVFCCIFRKFVLLLGTCTCWLCSKSSLYFCFKRNIFPANLYGICDFTLRTAPCSHRVYLQNVLCKNKPLIEYLH